MVDRLNFADDVFSRAKLIMKSKNHDYASESDVFSNLRECEKAGVPAWIGALVRCSDKYSREMEFANKRNLEVINESFVDTILDHINYLAITLTLYEEANDDSKRTNGRITKSDRRSGKDDDGGGPAIEGAISTVVSHKEAARIYEEAKESIQ